LQDCKKFGICGGCQYLDQPYEHQLENKKADVLDLLRARNISTGEFQGIVGSDRIYAYRNKMEYTFGDETKGGEMTLGMHRIRQFMSVVTIDECLLVDQDFNRVTSFTLEFFREREYPKYNKKTHQGFQRNLIIRKGERSGELLVNIVTTSDGNLDRAAYIDGLLALDLKSAIVGILHTINDSAADFVYSDRIETLYGRDYYMEEISGLKFKVSAFSFFQTNVPAVEKLYSTAMSFIDGLQGATVFDLYSGTGTIAQIAARQAKIAYGIELVPEAVEAATANARLNGLDNCRFLAGDVFEVLDAIEDKPDVIILDPPRSGVHPKALVKILNYRVKQIIYISCNPKSMAENLETMQGYGYKVEKLILFDNFPHTRHVEAAAGLRLE